MGTAALVCSCWAPLATTVAWPPLMRSLQLGGDNVYGALAAVRSCDASCGAPLAASSATASLPLAPGHTQRALQEQASPLLSALSAYSIKI